MKLTAHEEYGLRCLVQIGRAWPESSLTIPEVSKKEGISPHHAAKLLQILRQGGFLKSVRGQIGGYSLALPPDQIAIRDVLSMLGGRLYEDAFCQGHKGRVRACTHSTDCAIRSLWRSIQAAVDGVLERTTLQDLLRQEDEMASWLGELVPLQGRQASPPLG
ncbi:MAG: Rrf2 family transcriptional regulator [Bryobacteraceae bacterium]